MGDFIDIAGGILSRSEQRVEIAAQNVANITTPGYKRRISFSELVASGAGDAQTTSGISSYVDFAPGKAMDTTNPYDLAITGDGFFAVRSGDRVLYTRAGQFQRAADGRVTTASGLPLQVQGGGDLVLKGAAFEVTEDGTVLEEGEPVARLAVVAFTDTAAVTPADGGLFAAPDDLVVEVKRPAVRQGALESSNVSTGDEMVSIMEALRRAESGQRLVGVYDDLMGRALTAFGQT